MLVGLFTIAGGLLAASALIVAKKPNAKELIDRLTPYQGWIGVALFFWGAWTLLDCIRYIDLLSHRPLLWIFALAAGLADLAVGFLLGFGLVTRYALAGSATARARGQQVRERLAAVQGPLGLLTMALGAIYLVWLYAL